MGRKLQLVTEKIRNAFLTGKFGDGRFPTNQEVAQKLLSLNDEDYEPLFKYFTKSEFNYEEVYTAFSTIIDDVDILYQMMEDQSLSILEQLSNSLKEHNGIKRELKALDTEANGIISGKLGKDYLQYVFYDQFNNLDNIDLATSSRDTTTSIPIIDIKSGKLYIPNSASTVIDLSHMYGRKLDFVVSDFQGSLIDNGFVGTSTTNAILNPLDPNRLVYRVKTSAPTSLKISFVLQLTPTKEQVSFNQVLIELDPEKKGNIRLYYKTPLEWKPVSGIGSTPIKYDKTLLKFETATSSHLKVEFLKEGPDIMDSNEYFIVLNNFAVLRATTEKRSQYQSKSIRVQPFSRETPFVHTISCKAESIIPDDCDVVVSVAKDKMIPGYFVNDIGEYVSPQSVNCASFILDSDNNFETRHVLLSDIKAHQDLPGIDNLINIDFDWIKVRSGKEDLKNEKIVFKDSNKKDEFENSLSSLGGIKWGDFNHPPSGILFGDENPITSNVYTWGDITSADANGWYRPNIGNITPTGVILPNISHLNLPEFYSNGMKFYSIYRFNPLTPPVETTIKIYNYQSRPVNSTNDYYPHNFIWKYNTKIINRTDTFLAIPASGVGIVDFPNSGYINGSIENVHYENHAALMYPAVHFKPLTTGVDFALLSAQSNIESYRTVPISITYSYQTFDKYRSFWESNIICDNDNSTIRINQPKNSDGSTDKIIKTIELTNLDTAKKETTKLEDTFTKVLKKGRYKIRIFTLSDETTQRSLWNPFTMSVDTNIRFVAKADPINMVGLDTLLFSTPYENDSRFAIYTDANNYKYVVIKEPSKNIVPGYEFNPLEKRYQYNTDNAILNIGHHRKFFYDGFGSDIEKYMTGSSGTYIVNQSGNIDLTWNDGRTPSDFVKSFSNKYYPVHTTYGNKIDLQDDVNHSGFLFYDSGENLSEFYTLEYEYLNTRDKANDRFLYKIELISNAAEATPIVDSVRFIINEVGK